MAHDIGLEIAAVEKKLRACEPKGHTDFDGCWVETRAGDDYHGLMNKWFRLHELSNVRTISEEDQIDMMMGCCLVNATHVVDVEQELIV